MASKMLTKHKKHIHLFLALFENIQRFQYQITSSSILIIVTIITETFDLI